MRLLANLAAVAWSFVEFTVSVALLIFLGVSLLTCVWLASAAAHYAWSHL